MNDIKWIKITTDMFDNRKIRYIRKLPSGDEMVLIWVMLLTLAGRCNAGGYIMLTENFPYTLKMIADEFDFDANVVALALETFENLNMVSNDANCLRITGWEEYQSVEGMEKIREQNRERQARFKAKNKTPLLGNVTDNVTVTLSNATDIEEEKDKEIELRNTIKEKPARKTFVRPTIDEVAAYCKERGNKINPQRFMDYYDSNGWVVGRNHMKDWKATIRTWEARDGYSAAEPEPVTELPNTIKRGKK